MNPPDARLPAVCQIDPTCRLLRELLARPELFAAIEAHSRLSELALQSQLRRTFADDLVRLAILVHQLRHRARSKFSLADEMWFDRVGYEQSTAEAVARHKARRFPTGEPVWDLCAGIGGDAIAIAENHPVIAVDREPASLWRTLHNAEVYGVADQVTCRHADVEAMEPMTGYLHIDPDRRAGGSNRAQRIEEYVPGLEFLQRLTARHRGGAIKLSPASNFGGKFPQAEIELISLAGECKEATVWFGDLASEHPFRATVLPSGASLAGHPLSHAAPVVPLESYLYDPDPAVVRAGLVDLCAETLQLSRLDAAEEYLTSAQLIDSPFVTAFRVLRELPNNERELRSTLREFSAGNYEIKCRHIHVSADALRKHLPRKGTDQLTIFVARLAGKARMIVAQRMGSA